MGSFVDELSLGSFVAGFCWVLLWRAFVGGCGILGSLGSARFTSFAAR